ncbi:hypothetical protein K438DRAFT_1776680 [Mycena galopus ATCC 62051]|nr:hypothetical protein K438DRAFT_1776680 [Mycena galopus ATCC 62051]
MSTFSPAVTFGYGLKALAVRELAPSTYLSCYYPRFWQLRRGIQTNGGLFLRKKISVGLRGGRLRNAISHGINEEAGGRRDCRNLGKDAGSHHKRPRAVLVVHDAGKNNEGESREEGKQDERFGLASDEEMRHEKEWGDGNGGVKDAAAWKSMVEARACLDFQTDVLNVKKEERGECTSMGKERTTAYKRQFHVKVSWAVKWYSPSGEGGSGSTGGVAIRHTTIAMGDDRLYSGMGDEVSIVQKERDTQKDERECNARALMNIDKGVQRYNRWLGYSLLGGSSEKWKDMSARRESRMQEAESVGGRWEGRFRQEGTQTQTSGWRAMQRMPMRRARRDERPGEREMHTPIDARGTPHRIPNRE